MRLGFSFILITPPFFLLLKKPKNEAEIRVDKMYSERRTLQQSYTRHCVHICTCITPLLFLKLKRQHPHSIYLYLKMVEQNYAEYNILNTIRRGWLDHRIRVRPYDHRIHVKYDPLWLPSCSTLFALYYAFIEKERPFLFHHNKPTSPPPIPVARSRSRKL